MNESWGLLADDLTGAMDAGMQLPGTPGVGFTFNSPEIGWNVFSTESRNLAPTEAADRVRKAVSDFYAAGGKLCYKKIDSALRGHLAEELEIALQEGHFQAAVVAPALPEKGRCTVDGVHYVNGVPVAETEFGSDPFAAPKSSNICALLEEKLRCVQISRKDSHDLLLVDMQRALEDHAQVLVMDAQSDVDLEQIAKAVRGLKNVLPCGSAGLIAHLVGAESKPCIRKLKGPLLVLSGTPAEMTKRSIRTAQMTADHTLFVNAEQADVQKITSQALQAFEKGQSVVVDFAASERSEILRIFKHDTQALVVRQQQILAAVGSCAQACIKTKALGSLAVFGGDTLRAVCEWTQANCIRIEGILEPLVPIGRISGGLADGLQIVCRAGGFGSKETVNILLSSIKE